MRCELATTLAASETALPPTRPPASPRELPADRGRGILIGLPDHGRVTISPGAMLLPVTPNSASSNAIVLINPRVHVSRRRFRVDSGPRRKSVRTRLGVHVQRRFSGS
jgi:hypothetical protein